MLTVLPDGTGITNWFDVLGQLTATDDGSGIRAFYYNNNQGLVTNIITWQGDLQRTTYDIEDRPIYQAGADGVTYTNAYDSLGRLRTRTAPDGGAEVVASGHDKCDCIESSLIYNSGSYAYNANQCNSNYFANQLLKCCGVSLPRPSGAWGWNDCNDPKKEFQCPSSCNGRPYPYE